MFLWHSKYIEENIPEASELLRGEKQTNRQTKTNNKKTA